MSGGAWDGLGYPCSPEVCVPSTHSVMGATFSKCLWHLRASQVDVYDHTIELTHMLEDSQEKNTEAEFHKGFYSVLVSGTYQKRTLCN